MRIAFCQAQACLLAAVFFCLCCQVSQAQVGSSLSSVTTQVIGDQPVVALTPSELASFSLATAALEKQVNGDYMEAPLTTVVWRLRRVAGCTILIDEKALADAAIGTDTQITLSLGRNTLRTVLDEALRPHALAWLPKHPGILITTREQVDTNPDYHFTYLYPVADLVYEPGYELGDYDTLIDAITSTVHPESWKEGGTGEAVVASMPSAEALVVTQPFEIQERIGAFLEALRQVQRKQGRLPRVTSSSNDDDRYLVRPSSARRRRTYWSATAVPLDPPQAAPRPPRRNASGFF
jgi:hypothetical protein